MKSEMDRLEETCQFLKLKIKTPPLLGLTLGSGLSALAKQVQVEARIAYKDIPNFSPPTVEGHPGELLFGSLEGVPVAVLTGRIHFYEGHSMQQVVFPTRVLGKLGVKSLILTNAAGGLNPQMRPGDLMIITDQINLTGDNPLRGPNLESLGPRFPDMSQPYDAKYIETLTSLSSHLGFGRTSRGVYCGVAGPCYETAAEVRFLGQIGGSAVGMSTVAEAIAARHMGIRVCGISCITNLGAGLSASVITHEEVKFAAAKAEKDFTRLLVEFVKWLKTSASLQS